MNVPTFRRLLDPEGQRVLAAARDLQPTIANLLNCQQRLRKSFADDLVMAALDILLLRHKAKDKFTLAERMYFTRPALEQASGELISAYRAQRYTAFASVADICCGIGGDTLGLACNGRVIASDADELRLAMAAENLRVYGRSARVQFQHGDVLQLPWPDVQAAFFDPDRRADGRRHLRIADYQPSLAAVQARLPRAFPLGVKVAPGAPWSDLDGYDAEKEFISVAGELKECVMWFGSLGAGGRRATVLPGPATLSAMAPVATAAAVTPLAYLYDPDPAVVRSGLVANLGEILAAQPIDPDIAYLTSSKYVVTPFARCYEIEASMPFHSKRLGEALRALDVGHVSMTKRGSAVDVDELRRKWKLSGTESRTVILTRCGDKPWAFIARPVTQ